MLQKNHKMQSLNDVGHSQQIQSQCQNIHRKWNTYHPIKQGSHHPNICTSNNIRAVQLTSRTPIKKSINGKPI